MKNRSLRSALLLGASFLLTTGAFAQDKTKAKKDESKLKTESGYKVKTKKDETKIKGSLPVRAKVFDRSSSVKIEKKTGETDVTTKTGMVPLETRTTVTESQAPTIVTPAPVVLKMEKKVSYSGHRKVAAKRKAPVRKVAARRPAVKKVYVAKTKIIRDTVFVDKEPIVRTVTNTEYVHDTVMLTRVDTVFKTQTFTGYKMPAVNYKKVRVKNKGGEIIMKKKTEDGKWIKEKFDDENDYNTYRHETEIKIK